MRSAHGIEGVYSSRRFWSWPIGRPSAMLDLLPQLADRVRWRRRPRVGAEIRRVVDELDRDGVAILKNAVPHSLLNAALRDIDRLVERMPELEGILRTKPGSTGGTRDYLVHEYQQDLNVFRSHDPLVFSPTYARFLVLPQLIAVATAYLGTPWYYQAMIATRTEPLLAPTRAGFAQWHHDARGRKLNVFLLLTDVPDDGAATIVLKGSHRLVYTRDRRERNFFQDEEVESLAREYGGEERVCHAPAGSLLFFDSQALHRGRRSPLRRDAFQVNCMSKRSHLWPQEIPREVLASLDPADQRALLERANLRVI